MEKTVDEKNMGLSCSWPVAPSNQLKPLQQSSGSYHYSSDAGARFWHHHQPPPFCSPPKMSMGMGMGMRMRMFPFTAAQWQELQRQALIYKHIVASVPVPSDLIHPSAARCFPEAPTIFLPPAAAAAAAMFVGGEMSGRVVGGGGDLEAGRCRRTDGKKWRCARDAAPEQKYCERHLHRGRPRSRKPVEHRRNTNNSSRCKALNPVVACPSPSPATVAAVVDEGSHAGAGDLMPNIGLNLHFQSMETSHEPRREDWMKSYQESLASCGQWEAMRHYEDLPNLNGSWCPFLNANLPSVHETSPADCSEPPRRFIDAWSSENAAPTATTYHDDSSVSRRNKLPLPALTLSMSNATEDGPDNSTKSQPPLNWLAPDSPLGGPLAEVLQPSAMTSPRNSGSACSNQNSADLISLMCKYGHCGSHEASPRDSPSRLVSSPSGVLHKALVSLSDSSSSSSPTFAAAARSDGAFHWMNLHK